MCFRFASFLTGGDQYSPTELEQYDLFDESDEQLALVQEDNVTTDFENERSLLDGTVTDQQEWLSDDEAPNYSLISND